MRRSGILFTKRIGEQIASLRLNVQFGCCAAIIVGDNCLDRPAKGQRLAVRLDFHEDLFAPAADCMTRMPVYRDAVGDTDEQAPNPPIMLHTLLGNLRDGLESLPAGFLRNATYCCKVV